MKRNILTAFFLLAFAGFAFPQTASPNLLEKIQLRFDLAGNPTPADVGFDDSKSRWKLRYELLLSDEKTIRDLQSNISANCRQNSSGYSKCVSKANKKSDKKYKKTALFISRGAFEKTALSSSSNRSILVPVEFNPEVIGIFNKASESTDNPVFILQIKSRVTAKTAAKIKVRYKTSIACQYPLKFVRSDGSFDFYNVTTFGANVIVAKENDGNISYGMYKN